MNDDDKLRLRVNQPYIARSVELTDIIDHLISNGIVDDDFYHRLTNKFVNPTPKDSMTSLLFELPKKGPHAYEVFYVSLTEDYEHVQEKLNKTNIDAARTKFNAAKEKKQEKVKDDLHNLLRTTASLLETLQSGMDVMNPAPLAQGEPMQTEDNSRSPQDTSTSQQDDVETTDHAPTVPETVDDVEGVDLPDTSKEMKNSSSLFEFDDEVAKQNIINKVNELSECSRCMDQILTVVTNYIKLLQTSYEERKQQSMFFAEAVQAICNEVQFKLQQLDKDSKEIVSKSEDLMGCSSEEFHDRRQEVDELLVQIDKAQMDVVRAVNLVKPIAMEAQRTKGEPRRGSCSLS